VRRTHTLIAGFLHFSLLSGISQAVEVILPVRLVVYTQFVQVRPGEDAGIVAIVKRDFNGVVARRCELINANIFLASLQHFLARSVTTHLGRRRIDPQVFARQVTFESVIEVQLQNTAALVKLDFGGARESYSM